MYGTKDEETTLIAGGVNFEDRAAQSTIFYLLIVLLEVLGLACLTVVGIWCSHYLGGFAWDGSSKEFNYHPLFMVIGMVFLYGNCKWITPS